MTKEETKEFFKAWKPDHEGLQRPYASFRVIDTQKLIGEEWDWGTILWKGIERRCFNLQKRIYKATIDGRYSDAISLMKLLCATRLAVKTVGI